MSTIDPSVTSIKDTWSGDPPQNEGDLVHKLKECLRVGEWTPDLKDDCARFNLLTHTSRLIMTTDAIVEGRHFDCNWDKSEQVGRQAAIVNLSDLAGTGAKPRALLWSLSCPESLSERAILDMGRGLAQYASTFDARVYGGNICVRSGPIELHITALGTPYHHRLNCHRSDAKENDKVYVTGQLGSHALGYINPSPQTREKRHQWRAHIDESAKLCDWGHVHAMMDISDGLAIDIRRIAQASKVSIDIHAARLPIDPLCAQFGNPFDIALYGGEDYVLLFTAPSDQIPPIGQCIGEVKPLSSQPFDVTLDGAPLTKDGFDHYTYSAHVSKDRHG